MTYRPEDLPARFADKIQIDGWGHWIWTGATSITGYGHFRHEKAFARDNDGIRGRSGYSHRIVYELFKGRIPKGFVIDHRCEVKLCCNPDHLEAVTHSVNHIRRCRGQNYIPANTGTQLSLDDLLKQPQQIELL